MDGNQQWIGPDEIEMADIEEWELNSYIISLVLAMDVIGFSETDSLFIIESEWSEFTLTEQTHWQDILKMNKNIIGKIVNNRGVRTDEKIDSIKLVFDNWSFPLIDVELTTKNISENDLKEIQNNLSPE